MNIYELYLKKFRNGYDFYDSFVVVAKSARNARRLAAKHPHESVVGVISNPEFLDPKKTVCLKLGTVSGKLEPAVVCASFNAG